MAAIDQHGQRIHDLHISETQPKHPNKGEEIHAGAISIYALSNKELGRLGEEFAAERLSEMGYEILSQNYRCSEGEADIVAYDPAADTLVLVEVKSRRCRKSWDGSYPEEAVNAKKQRRYKRIAACFIMDHFPVYNIRFDVVAISFFEDGAHVIRHLPAAFDWGCVR